MQTAKQNSSQQNKFIFVTGGVLSGIGKGIVTASIAKLLDLYGISTTCVKIDPYLNVDAGTMNPFAHGEVFVTDDGGETDMDIGTYERFLNKELSKIHNLTTGQVYLDVIESERKGDFLGECVQIIPNITNTIKEKIKRVAEVQENGIVLVECGGTVGDIESLPFVEAIRQLRLEFGRENSLFIHVTLAPIMGPVGEEKTKPTQHSVQELRRIGIQPDIIVVRSEKQLSMTSKKKISLFTSVELESVISNPDAESIYNVPEILYNDGIITAIIDKLKLPSREMNWGDWKTVSKTFSKNKKNINIAMVGKYVSLTDSYVSVNEALSHAAAGMNFNVKLEWVESEDFENNKSNLKRLDNYDGIIVPGGFGKRGTDGIMLAADYARKNSIPFLGLCFGFQLALIAFARYVCGLNDANSIELDPKTKNPIINILPSQKKIKEKGGSMRLGGHNVELIRDTRAYKIYGKDKIRQRHRHRFEFNKEYQELLEKNKLVLSGFSDDGRRTEILEITDHPFYMATQYHPEFLSRPGEPEPIYNNFIKSVIEKKNSTKK
tara:strand:- start:2156 stop:3802 length:1647 start_codon:yes stop_codon:yes gene_type:complete